MQALPKVRLTKNRDPWKNHSTVVVYRPLGGVLVPVKEIDPYEEQRKEDRVKRALKGVGPQGAKELLELLRKEGVVK